MALTEDLNPVALSIALTVWVRGIADLIIVNDDNFTGAHQLTTKQETISTLTAIS
jgi:hypothetical protein